MIVTKFNIGDELKEKVTNYTGVVMAITKYSTGCIHYGLQPRTFKDKPNFDWEWFDEKRLILKKKNAVNFATEEKESGAFQNAPQQ